MYVLKIIQKSSNSLLFLTRFIQHGNFNNKKSHILHGNSRSTSAGHSYSPYPLIEINFILLQRNGFISFWVKQYRCSSWCWYIISQYYMCFQCHCFSKSHFCMIHLLQIHNSTKLIFI